MLRGSIQHDTFVAEAWELCSSSGEVCCKSMIGQSCQSGGAALCIDHP